MHSAYVVCMMKISSIRKACGFASQSDLAEYLGVDQSTISRWEKGRQEPSGPALVLLRQLEAQAKQQTQAAE